MDVRTEREQRQKMIILSAGMLRDLLEDEREHHIFSQKMQLNRKYKYEIGDKKPIRKKKDKLKATELTYFIKGYDRAGSHISALSESFISQDPELEQQLAEIGYEVMDEKFPIICN